MILSIYIENILLIEKVSFNLKSGLGIIIGETGAGKSIILDSIGICIGDRAKLSMLRNKDKNGIIVIEFDISKSPVVKEILEAAGINVSSNILTIKKIINVTGSRAFINDMPTNISLISKIRCYLIEIYSQFDQMQMLYENNHVEIVDAFMGKNPIHLDLSRAFLELKKKQEVFHDATIKLEELRKQEELLINTKNDIEELNLEENEEERLFQQKQHAMHYSKLKDVFDDIIQKNTETDLRQYLLFLRKKFDKIYNITGSSSDEIETSFGHLENAFDVFQKYFDSYQQSLLGKNLINIDVIEQRIFDIQRVARKYAVPSSTLLSLLIEVTNSLNKLHFSNEFVIQAEQEMQQAKDEYYKLANELSNIRKNSAREMRNMLLHKLSFLKLENADIEFIFEKTNETELGIDRVLLKVAMNKGMPMELVNKSASGGELSRLMLALKACIANRNDCKSIIFDEIDTGVSGEVARKIGIEMKSMSSDLQILCITHNPQITYFGDYHILIRKEHQNNQTRTIVKEIEGEERDMEIARMMSGDENCNDAIEIVRKMLRNEKT